VTGFEIKLYLSCYPANEVPKQYKVKEVGNGVCTIQPVPSPPLWVGIDEGSVHQKDIEWRFHGIRIRIVVGMRVRVFDSKSLFGWFANAVVYMHLPRVVFAWILKFCMGRMSEIYRNVLREDFTLSQHICAMMIDVLTKNVVFSFLADTPAGVSYKRVARKLEETIAWAGHIHRSQVDALALVGMAYASDNFGFNSLRQKDDLFQQPESAVMKKMIGTATQDTLEWLSAARSKVLNVVTFAQASREDHEVTMHALLHVMESPGKMRFLERLFVPWSLRNVYNLSKVLEEQRHPDGSMSSSVDHSQLDCDEDAEDKEGNGKEQGAPSASDFIHTSPECPGPDLKQDNTDDKFMELTGHMKQLQERVDRLQLTLESRIQSWSQQIEQNIFQKLQDHININSKNNENNNHNNSHNHHNNHNNRDNHDNHNKQNNTSSIDNDINSSNRHTALGSSSDSKDVGPVSGLQNATSLVQAEGEQNLAKNQRQLEACDSSVDLWLENLHTSIDRQQVNRIVGECMDQLRLIAQVSAQSAMTEVFQVQAVSRNFDQLLDVASLHTDAVTRDHIESVQSLVLDSAVSVKQHTTSILDMCLRLDRVSQNAPGRDPSRTSAGRDQSRTSESVARLTQPRA